MSSRRPDAAFLVLAALLSAGCSSSHAATKPTPPADAGEAGAAPGGPACTVATAALGE